MDEANKLNQHTRWNQGNLRESFLNFLDGISSRFLNGWERKTMIFTKWVKGVISQQQNSHYKKGWILCSNLS